MSDTGASDTQSESLTRRGCLKAGGVATLGLLAGGATVGNVSAQSGNLLNVLDYGAVGDGSTDDSGAINRAISEAGSGDTVYLPATGSSYLVRGAGEIIDIDSTKDGIRFVGDGPETRITYGGGNSGRNVYVVNIDPGNDGLEGVLVDHFTVDGGLGNVEGSPNVAAGVQVRDPGGGARGNVDMRIHNVTATNAYGNGIDVRSAGTVVSNCTAHDNRQHGFGMETGNDSFQDPPVVFEQCLAYGNGFGGGYYGLDLSGGKAVAVDSVIRDNAGGGTKTSVGTEEMLFRRVRIRDNGGVPFQNTTGRGATIEFDNVVATGNDGPFRLSEDGTYRIPSGSELVISNSGPDNRGGLFITDESVLEAGDATVWVNGHSGGAGINSNTSRGGTQIGTYHHSGNDGGAIDGDQNLSIASTSTDSKSDIDGVPDANQVGSMSGGYECESDD